MNNKISASVMCFDFFKIEAIVNALERNSISYLHMDIMDGNFVPNLGIGSDLLNSIRRNTTIPFDFHIMAHEPSNMIPLLNIKENDIVSIHYESSYYIKKLINELNAYKCKILLAIHPMTSLRVIEEYIEYIDGINLLMVNPGFAGQKSIKNAIERGVKASEILNKYNKKDFIFEVDGNITFEKAQSLKKIGANMFVAGTSSIFSSEAIEENTQRLVDILDS